MAFMLRFGADSGGIGWNRGGIEGGIGWESGSIPPDSVHESALTPPHSGLHLNMNDRKQPDRDPRNVALCPVTYLHQQSCRRPNETMYGRLLV